MPLSSGVMFTSTGATSGRAERVTAGLVTVRTRSTAGGDYSSAAVAGRGIILGIGIDPAITGEPPEERDDAAAGRWSSSVEPDGCGPSQPAERSPNGVQGFEVRSPGRRAVASEVVPRR